MFKKENDFYRSSLYLTFLDICRCHLIISQFTGKSYGTEVTPTCAFILSELNLNPALSLGDLAEIINLNKSSISRAVVNLIEDKYLEKKDTFKLLKRGHDFLKLQDDFNEQQLNSLSANLSMAELKRLAQLYTEFVNEASAPEAQSNSQDPKQILLVAIRRVTRLWEITGPNAFGSDYNALDWLLLSELHYNKITLSQLAGKLRMPLNTLSQRMKSYNQNGLIAFVHSSSDQRSKFIVLGKAGIAALKSIEDKARATIAVALDQHTLDYIEEFVELFWKYTFSAVNYRAARLQLNSYFVKVDSEIDLESLRWLLVRNLNSSKAKNTYKLTENFFSEKNYNLKLIESGEIIGGLELVELNERNFRVVNTVLPEVSLKDYRPVLKKLLGSEISISVL